MERLFFSKLSKLDTNLKGTPSTVPGILDPQTNNQKSKHWRPRRPKRLTKTISHVFP